MFEQTPARATARLLPTVAMTLLIAAAAACAKTADTAAPGPAGDAGGPPAATATGQAPALPAGWRWESYGGVEVGVPGDWGWGNGSQRLGQWCLASKQGVPKPIVGRPGVTTLVGCPADGRTPKPETLVTVTGEVVSFGRTKDTNSGVTHEGDRTTVRLAGVEVVVQAAAALRQRIVATVHRVDVDSYGCPATHPVSGKPQQRPAKPVGVTALKDVTTVSACRYRIGRDAFDSAPRLISSLRLDGPAAAAAIQKVAGAPRGGGPNHPDQCLPEASYGQESIVLRVRSASGTTEIVLRYSGCDHNGFDDGVTVRSLTAGAVAPFITGANDVSTGHVQAELLPIMRPGTPNR